MVTFINKMDICFKIAIFFTFFTICKSIEGGDEAIYVHDNFNIGLAITPMQPKNIVKRTMRLKKDSDYNSDETFESTKKVSDRPHKDIDRSDLSMSSQFFNLVPAVDDSIKLDENVRDSSWFTIENSPCFNLPLVYGHVYPGKFKNRDVFSMYKDTIDDVKEPNKYPSGDFTNMTHKMTQIRHKSNKWCEAIPCYADHTLCMFVKAKMAVCGKRYKVKKPNALERVGIINSINSMRNKLANGHSLRYSHLPTAANMQKVLYDRDLERMAQRWLMQCIPGSAPCSSLDDQMVTELECTKFAKDCCVNTDPSSNCKAKDECYVFSVIGCLYIWYWEAGNRITRTDVTCGRTTRLTYATVQLFWAKTSKIGCAYAVQENGDERVVCNFSPSASFFIDSKLYCGILLYHDNKTIMNVTQDIFSSVLRLSWKYNKNDYTFSLLKLRGNASIADPTYWKRKKYDTIKNFVTIYKYEKAREFFGDWKNGTKCWISVQVAKHKFLDKSASKCDSGEQIFQAGEPGSLCDERGRLYYSLCDAFRDPTPGYRLITLVAAIVLFSLVLCNLFSGVVRQNNF